MTNPETFKQLFKEAREEVMNWPEWMKGQEQDNSPQRVRCGESRIDESEDRLSA